jgi:hypothetical protein
MKTLQFKLSGEQLWICDMRPGISQDGVRVKLPPGDYQCEVTPSEGTGLTTVSYVRKGARPTSERHVGGVSLDMARVGVVELKPLLAQHGGDWEALADWSDEMADRGEKRWGGVLMSALHHAAFFRIGSDCTLDVFRLKQDGRDVGVALRPQARHVADTKSQRWTWVEVKLRGIGEPWSYCDDWAFFPDNELVLFDIEFELSYFTKEKIDHKMPLAKYCPKIGGIDWIKVFVEDRGAARRAITRVIRIPEIQSPVTATGLATGVLGIFEQVRKNA